VSWHALVSRREALVARSAAQRAQIASQLAPLARRIAAVDRVVAAARAHPFISGVAAGLLALAGRRGLLGLAMRMLPLYSLLRR